MMVRSAPFEHEGILYDVIDWHYVGVRRQRVELNSRRAEGRAFVPRDVSQPVRIYLFRGGINYGKSDPETLAQQFKETVTAQWTR